MKQYILKPGNHQFAPRSPAAHNNDNLTDAEAKWYLEKYPHIKSLFQKLPGGNDIIIIAETTPLRVKRKRKSVKQ